MLMWHIDQVQAAWKLAARLHKGQTYVGPIEGEYTDYLAHIGTVALEITHAFHQDPSLAIDPRPSLRNTARHHRGYIGHFGGY